MNDSQIITLIENSIQNLGFEDCYYLEHKISGNKIEIFLDSDTGVTFEKCQKISRCIEAELDIHKPFGENYVLEISSAGVGRPLLNLRQYPKNIGRIIEIRHKTDKKIKGKLKNVISNTIIIESEAKVKEGKKNKTITVIDEIKFEEIIEAKIKINFSE